MYRVWSNGETNVVRLTNTKLLPALHSDLCGRARTGRPEPVLGDWVESKVAGTLYHRPVAEELWLHAQYWAISLNGQYEHSDPFRNQTTHTFFSLHDLLA